MPSVEEKIREIEDEISRTPYNKATQHHIGKLKAKLAQLKEELTKRKSKKSGGAGFGVRKGGDASIVLVGFPSVGKSTLLNSLTDVESKIGGYEFTTLDVIPGLMSYKGAKIQILDLPGIITGSHMGKGRGREIMSIVRTTDLVLVLLDVNKPEQIETVRQELYEAGLRMNEHKPRVKIKKISRGGIVITSSIKLTKMDERMIKDILSAYGIHSAELTFHDDVDVNQFIDVIMDNRSYVPLVIAVNKMDSVDEKTLRDALSRVGGDAIPVSAKEGKNLEDLMGEIYSRLELIRVYLRPHAGGADYDNPLILRKDSTVRDVCRKIHKDFERKFKYARIWGSSVKFPGQKKGLSHALSDGDEVNVVIER